MNPRTMHQSLPLLRAAIGAQLALWDALRDLEHTIGERQNPSWDDIVVLLASECDASADELTDAALLDALASGAQPPASA